VLRRLGDGYYEQQLIRRQVVALTGNRYLNGYSNDEAQYRALMDAGVLFGKTYSLTPGVALSAQQMALLTSDMVWLVTQTVSLPDGSTQQVLVPQLYARVKPGDLDGSGALLSGNDVSLAVSNDLTNSGHITGRTLTQLTADNLNNSGFIGGDKVDLRARADINNIGGTLQGGCSLTAIAGRDLNSISTLGGSAGNITFDRPAGIYVQGENGTLGLQAMNDINLTAAQISNAGAGSQTQIIAGHDLNLNTLTTTGSESGDWGGGNSRSLTQSTEVGSQINGGGDVSLLAGNDLNARAAAVTAQDSLSAVAGNDLNLTSGNATYHLTEDSHQSSGGLLSRKSVTTHDEVQSQTAIGSSFSGDSVSLQAGRDLTLSGSNVVGTNDVALSAGRDLTLTTAEEMRQENHQYKETKSGLSGTGGIGFTAGSSSLKVSDDALSHSSAGSTVGSTNGNVSLTAGNTLTVKGSDLLAAQDLTLSGSEVNILAAENQSTQKHTVEQKQSGLTLALSGVVGSAINSAVTMATDAGSETSGRLAVLKGMQAALTGVQAYQGASLAEAGGSAGSLVGVNLSYGSQSSKSEQTMTQNQHQGSQLTAGNNLSITASKTDINIQGSKLQAGGDASLSAARDLNLISSQDSQKLEGKNKSQGASVGVGINFGQGANGLSLNASVNAGRGSESGNGTTHNETTVSAGNNLNIVSGRDTTLTGAQVSGEKVALEVGRNLTMTSEQDSDNYDSKQQNASAGGSVSMGGGSGTVSLSQDKMHSTWRSVQEQTGIFAGSGGFDVTVGEHTQLNGAVMDSSADADKNRLDTGTLGWSDIKNEAEYKVQHQSVGVSSGGSMGAQFAGNAANNLLTGANRSGSDSSTTKSAVSEGTIIIRDPQGQQQNVADISRDTKNANAGLGKIFDKEKEQQRLKEAQLIGQIGAQVGDIARTQGQIAGERAKNDPAALEAARDKLAASGKPYTDEDVAKQAYNTAMAPYGTGSSLQQGIGAATAAIQGLAGGNIAQAVSGAASPYLAEQIHNMTTDASGKVNTEANLIAHAVLGAVVAQAQGNSALAGAAGATTGEYIAQQLYPGIDRKDLTEEQRQTISALGTLAAGLAGGIVGDSTGNAVASAQAGKNSSENNNLSLPGGMGSYGQAAASLGSSMIDAGATTEVINTALSKNAKGDLPEGANITKAIVEGYKDGVLIAGAAYLGPAASIGKVIAGATIAEIANGTYQWFDLSQPGNENNSWDYWGSASAAVTGALAPGRDIWKNVGIAAAGSVFTDGPDALAVGSSAAGAWAGGIFGQYMPGVVNSVTGKELPNIVYDFWGSVASEFATGFAKDINGASSEAEGKNK
jgi:filamentous hemagglutinin